MRSLLDSNTGCFLVATESGSRYRLDLDRRSLTRTPGTGADTPLRLRGDGEPVVLVEILSCEVGAPMLLLIDLGVPGVVVTSRESTPVVRIDQLPCGTATS